MEMNNDSNLRSKKIVKLWKNLIYLNNIDIFLKCLKMFFLMFFFRGSLDQNQSFFDQTEDNGSWPQLYFLHIWRHPLKPFGINMTWKRDKKYQMFCNMVFFYTFPFWLFFYQKLFYHIRDGESRPPPAILWVIKTSFRLFWGQYGL